jgi:hypothetical protein
VQVGSAPVERDEEGLQPYKERSVSAIGLGLPENGSGCCWRVEPHVLCNSGQAFKELLVAESKLQIAIFNFETLRIKEGLIDFLHGLLGLADVGVEDEGSKFLKGKQVEETFGLVGLELGLGVLVEEGVKELFVGLNHYQDVDLEILASTPGGTLVVLAVTNQGSDGTLDALDKWQWQVYLEFFQLLVRLVLLFLLIVLDYLLFHFLLLSWRFFFLGSGLHLLLGNLFLDLSVFLCLLILKKPHFFLLPK